jgi:hypothetical protein
MRILHRICAAITLTVVSAVAAHCQLWTCTNTAALGANPQAIYETNPGGTSSVTLNGTTSGTVKNTDTAAHDGDPYLSITLSLQQVPTSTGAVVLSGGNSTRPGITTFQPGQVRNYGPLLRSRETSESISMRRPPLGGWRKANPASSSRTSTGEAWRYARTHNA